MSRQAHLSVDRIKNHDEITVRVVQLASIRSRLPKSRVKSRFLVVDTNCLKVY
jgi:hypothetical protein